LPGDLNALIYLRKTLVLICSNTPRLNFFSWNDLPSGAAACCSLKNSGCLMTDYRSIHRLSSPAHLLCAAEAGDDWVWFKEEMPDANVSWEFVVPGKRSRLERIIRKPNLSTVKLGIKTARAAQKNPPSLIVAHGPRVAFWASIMNALFGNRAPLLAHTFNFTRLPHHVVPRPIGRFIYSLGFRNIDRFVVFSTFEADLYSRYFRLARDRFDVVLWGMDPPRSEPAEPIVDGPYVCSIGGNARDYKTLIGAATRLPHIKFVLVVRPDSLEGLTVPSNVEVLINIAYERAMNVLMHSRFMVLPLEGSEVPCGHVTMVSCMLLGRAFIVTDSAGVSDYAYADRTAVLVPVADIPSMADAVDRLWQNPKLCERLGANAEVFAKEHCSPDRLKSHLMSTLDGLARKKTGAGHQGRYHEGPK
jgi:glycosyltransferase involved in cell wall biosynthesis